MPTSVSTILSDRATHDTFSSTSGNDLVFMPSMPPVRGGLPPGALRRVRDYVGARLEDNIGIQGLADAAGLSM